MINNELTEIVKILWLSTYKNKIYNSNIWYIIIPKDIEYVYKIYKYKEFYDKEKYAYKLFTENGIIIPTIEDIWIVNNFYVTKIENVRKHFARKDEMTSLDIKKVAMIISKVHSIVENDKHFLLWDIHSSNFFEYKKWEDIELWIFDFTSSKYWYIEEDIANIYIDVWMNKDIFNTFIDNYKYNINYDKLYNFTILELYWRIKNWITLPIDKKRKYYKYLLILKNENKRI